MAYVIDPRKCDACALCVEECPVGAITLGDKAPFVIDTDLCTDCGSCADVCPREAIRGG